ncbi:hypothetical protein GCM10009678_26980 [Actinomadura kijaniata]
MRGRGPLWNEPQPVLGGEVGARPVRGPDGSPPSGRRYLRPVRILLPHHIQVNSRVLLEIPKV